MLHTAITSGVGRGGEGDEAPSPDV